MLSAPRSRMILSPKHLPRLISTIRLFTNYGLRDFANRQGLLAIEGVGLDGDQVAEGDARVKAEAFRERLVELGPAYIKLGQVLSTRPDLLPKPYIDELEHLQDDVPPMSFEDVENTIESELQARISKLFDSFESDPLGSASLIPRVIDAYTTHKVLTTERIRGVKIDDIPPISRIEYDFTQLADEFSHAYLQQITDSGHFHADPHPGNVFIVLPGRDNPRTPAEAVADDRRHEVRPGATALVQSENKARAAAAEAAPREDPKLALIDFGMTAHLTTAMRDHVVRLLMAMAENDGDAAAETLVEIGQAPEDFDRRMYIRDVSALIAKHANQTVEETPAGVVLYEIISIAFRNGLKLPAELTLLAKALFNLDAVSRALDPNFNPTQSIREYTAEIANKRARREFSPRRLFQIAAETSDLVRALPHRIDVITQKLISNDFAVRVEAPQLGSLLLGLEKVANRIFTGLVLGGLLVASGLLMAYQRSLAMIGFLIAGILGLWMVFAILVQDRRSRKDR